MQLLYNVHLRNNKDYQRNFRLFLSATVRNQSPVSLLRNQTDILPKIREFLKPDKNPYYYKMSMFCNAVGGEDVWVEALQQPSPPEEARPRTRRRLNRRQPRDNRETLACLNSTAMFADMVILDYMKPSDDDNDDAEPGRGWAFLRNQDGTFLNEMQLRELYHDAFTDEDCCGCCGVLPGDTVFWKSTESGLSLPRQMTRFEPATEEELKERGYVNKDGKGMLSALAELARKKSEQQD